MTELVSLAFTPKILKKFLAPEGVYKSCFDLKKVSSSVGVETRVNSFDCERLKNETGSNCDTTMISNPSSYGEQIISELAKFKKGQIPTTGLKL